MICILIIHFHYFKMVCHQYSQEKTCTQNRIRYVLKLSSLLLGTCIGVFTSALNWEAQDDCITCGNSDDLPLYFCLKWGYCWFVISTLHIVPFFPRLDTLNSQWTNMHRWKYVLRNVKSLTNGKTNQTRFVVIWYIHWTSTRKWQLVIHRQGLLQLLLTCAWTCVTLATD